MIGAAESRNFCDVLCGNALPGAISEATRRLHIEMRERHATLPWRQIMDAGNFYRHDYGNVSESFVWRKIHESLEPLLNMVDAEIEAPPEAL